MECGDFDLPPSAERYPERLATTLHPGGGELRCQNVTWFRDITGKVGTSDGVPDEMYPGSGMAGLRLLQGSIDGLVVELFAGEWVPAMAGAATSHGVFTTTGRSARCGTSCRRGGIPDQSCLAFTSRTRQSPRADIPGVAEGGTGGQVLCLRTPLSRNGGCYLGFLHVGGDGPLGDQGLALVRNHCLLEG